MTPTFVSCSCGKRLQVPPALAGKRVKCPGCGNGLSLPGPPSTPGQTCPKCSAPAVKEAVICVNCGHNFKTGKTISTVVEKLNWRWHGGFSLAYRLTAPTIIMVIAILFFLLYYYPQNIKNRPDVALQLAIGVVSLSFLAVMLVLTFGTYVRLVLIRDASARPVLTKSYMVAFLPLVNRRMDLQSYRAILTDYQQGPSPVMIGLMIVGVIAGALPGVALYLLTRNRDTLSVRLQQDGEEKLDTVYLGSSETHMRLILDEIQNASGLPCHRQ